MYFDINSMKNRARELITSNKLSMVCGVFIIAIFWLLVISWGRLSTHIGVLWGLFIWLIFMAIFLSVLNSIKMYCMKISRGEKALKSDIFIAFKKNQVKAFFLALIKGICIFLGLAGLILGALIPIYLFRFAEYILNDNEEYSPMKALGKSMDLIRGHFLELIRIDISLLAFLLLCVFSGGLAGIYTIPYTQMVYAEYYDYLKGLNENNE